MDVGESHLYGKFVVVAPGQITTLGGSLSLRPRNNSGLLP